MLVDPFLLFKGNRRDPIRSFFFSLYRRHPCRWGERGGAARSCGSKLMLFGGADHDVYLGCLNCGKFATDSVCNQFGRYGSEFSAESIWNEFSRYGSEFSAHSPWNEFSTQAPAIVDSDGDLYGYFSANAYHPKRIRIKALVTVLNLAGKLKRGDLRKCSATER